MRKYLYLTILIFGILLIVKPADAVTEFISTIKSSGGDYSSLSAWEAAIQSDLTPTTTRVFSGTGTGKLSQGDTVTCVSGGTHNGITAMVIATTSDQILLKNATSSEAVVLSATDQWQLDASNYWTVSGTGAELGDEAIAVAECYAFQDTTAVTINGWTTDATHYIKVYTPTSERHNGKWDDNKYRLVCSTTVLTISESNVKLEGLQIHLNNISGSYYAIRTDTDTDNVLVDSCIIRGNGNTEYGSNTGIMLDSNADGSTWKVINSIIYNQKTRGLCIYYANNSILEVYNCTIYGPNVGDGIKRYENQGSTIVKNCAVFSWSDDFNGVAGIDYCASDDGDGTNAVTPSDWFSVFVDYTNADFHLQGNDTQLRNAGIDLSSEGFTDDIDGQTRGYRGYWDIGADETFRTTQINTPLTGKFESGLVGYWSFNGQDVDWSTNTAYDRSGQGNNGSITNMSTSSVPVIGISGQALDFDGSDDYVSVADDNSLDIAGSLTISAWLISPPTTGIETIIAKGAIGGVVNYGLSIENNVIWFYTQGTTNANWKSNVKSSDYCSPDCLIIGVFNGTNKSIFVNGVERGLIGTTGTPTVNVLNLSIGASNSNAHFYDGTIDEVRIYNRALSADEVMEHYRAGARKLQPDTPFQPKGESGLVGYWSFNGQDVDWASTTAEVLDRSGEGNNGNVTNFGKEAVRAGISGQALDFDGIDDYVDILDSVAGGHSFTDIGNNNDYSIAAWIKTSAAANDAEEYWRCERTITELRQEQVTGAHVAFSFGIEDTYLCLGRTDNYISTDERQLGTIAVNDGTWHNVVMEVSNNTVNFYVDGNLDISRTFILTTGDCSVGATTSNMQIGIASKDDGTKNQEPFNGTIDEVRIYNRALSADEVMELYRAGARRMKIEN